ncbi:MAG: hypothetical protein K2X87_32940 [Gemmataceae bacterium]|nr:hypothetical protein [Gemmataceae bacterium]
MSRPSAADHDGWCSHTGKMPVPRDRPPMNLIAPDILAEAQGLSKALLGTAVALGVGLWLFGWRWHRFWVVAGVTLAAGLAGLSAGRAGGGQVVAVGVLVAVAAGVLALELARVGAFVAGGAGAWLLARWLLPQAQELWAVFLGGGLLGVLLYRLWLMLLTSLAGALIAGYSAVLLFVPDPVAWAAGRSGLLDGGVIGAAALGVVIQALTAPKRGADDEDQATADNKKRKKERHEPHEGDEERPARGWRLFRPRHTA